MALIYKHGFPDDTDPDEAVVTAKTAALESAAVQDLGGTVLEVGIIRTAAHKEAGEYLVRVVVGDPPAEEPSRSSEEVERQQLLARLAELDASTA